MDNRFRKLLLLFFFCTFIGSFICCFYCHYYPYQYTNARYKSNRITRGV